MAGIDHQPFIIRFVNQNFQKFFPNTFSAPTDEPLMNAAPFPVIGRQISPGRPGSQYPKHRINKTPVILSDSSPLAALSRQMGFQQRPHVIAYVMSVIGCFHLFLSCLFMMLPFYHIPFVLRRHYLSGPGRENRQRQGLTSVWPCLMFCLRSAPGEDRASPQPMAAAVAECLVLPLHGAAALETQRERPSRGEQT